MRLERELQQVVELVNLANAVKGKFYKQMAHAWTVLTISGPRMERHVNQTYAKKERSSRLMAGVLLVLIITANNTYL